MALSWAEAEAPGEEAFEALAAAAFAALPPAIRAACDGLAIRIADFADDATLDEMGIEDAFELTGLYRGVSLPEKSSGDVAPMPDEVWLYRRPIPANFSSSRVVSISSIRAAPWAAVVFTGTCQPAQERAGTPISCKVIAISPLVTCSPDATTLSYSRAS